MPLNQENIYFGSWMVTGYLDVGVWQRKAGVWSLVATEGVYVQDDVGGGGQHTVGWSLQNTYNLGPGVEAFGATIQGHDGAAATLSYLAASWSASSASGERSATPSGQLSTVTVRPV
jgi:hypothetical protein